MSPFPPVILRLRAGSIDAPYQAKVKARLCRVEAGAFAQSRSGPRGVEAIRQP